MPFICSQCQPATSVPVPAAKLGDIATQGSSEGSAAISTLPRRSESKEEERRWVRLYHQARSGGSPSLAPFGRYRFPMLPLLRPFLLFFAVFSRTGRLQTTNETSSVRSRTGLCLDVRDPHNGREEPADGWRALGRPGGCYISPTPTLTYLRRGLPFID